MGKRIFTQEIKDYIFGEIDRRGSVLVDDVAEIIKELHLYDPLTAEEQWYLDKARRLMASRKDKNGVRLLFATGDASGTFINIETCKSLPDVRSVVEQLIEKRDGINAAIAKGQRRRAELEGQISLFSSQPVEVGQQLATHDSASAARETA